MNTTPTATWEWVLIVSATITLALIVAGAAVRGWKR